jgi:hypothetical protein
LLPAARDRNGTHPFWPAAEAGPVVRQDPFAARCHELADRVAADWDEIAERLLGLDRPEEGAARPPPPAALSAAPMPAAPGLAARLPWSGQWRCGGCGQTVAGQVSASASASDLLLETRCERCGPRREALRDGRVSASGAPPPTLGRSTSSFVRALPVALDTLCPECSVPLVGRAFTIGAAVWIEKTCPQHGYFRDHLDADSSFYLRLAGARFALEPFGQPAEPASQPSAARDDIVQIALDAVASPAGGPAPSGLDAALRALDEARQTKRRACLAARITKSFNESQVGPLLRFAAHHSDVVDALVFKPATFGAQVSMQQLGDRRYTLGELARALAGLLGADPARDFLPLDDLAPVWRFLTRLSRRPRVELLAGGRLAFGAYLAVTPDEHLTPLAKLVDARPMLARLDRIVRAIARRGPTARASWLERVQVALALLRHFRPAARHGALPPWAFIRTLRRPPRAAAPNGWTTPFRLLLVAGIQEIDRYNFDAAEALRRGG